MQFSGLRGFNFRIRVSYFICLFAPVPFFLFSHLLFNVKIRERKLLLFRASKTVARPCFDESFSFFKYLLFRFLSLPPPPQHQRLMDKYLIQGNGTTDDSSRGGGGRLCAKTFLFFLKNNKADGN